MKKLKLLSLMIWCFGTATVYADCINNAVSPIIFEDGFETANTCWTHFDLDNNAFDNTPPFVRSDGNYYVPFAHTGTYGMVAGKRNINDNPTNEMSIALMVSPQLALPAGSIPKLSFWSRSFRANNKISVLVFTDISGIVPNQQLGSSGYTSIWGPTDFTFNSELTDQEYEKIELDLSAFAGQNIYIGFYYNGNGYNSHGLWSIDDVKVYTLAGDDVGATAIVAPQTGLALTANEQVKVKVRNFGQNAVSNIPVSLKINGTPVATETINGTLGSERDTTYTFQYRADMSAVQDYVLEATTTLANDADDSNNSITATVHNYGTFVIAQFPYTQNFEANNTNLIFWSQQVGQYHTNPLEWTFRNGNTDIRHLLNAHSGTRNATYSTFEIPPAQAIHTHTAKLVTPRINLAAVNVPIVKFWHAQPAVRGTMDTLKVYYKTSLAGEWQLLYTENRILNNWTETSFALPNQTDDYYLAFEAKSANGVGVLLDDVTIDDNNDIDAKIIAIVEPNFSAGVELSNVSVKIKVQNFGGVPLTNIPVVLRFNGTDYNSTISGTLNTFQETDYVFPTTLNFPLTEGDYTITAFVDYAGDINHSNDTAKITIRNYVGKAIMGLVENVQTCNTIFYDNGVDDDYKNANVVEKITFRPTGTDKRIKAVFDFYDIAPRSTYNGYIISGGDSLFVYDGIAVQRDRLIAVLTDNSDNNTPAVFQSGVPNGALTFVFKKTSDDRAAGWKAQITCEDAKTSDVGVKEIISPTSPIRTNTAQVKVKIQNFGETAMQGFDVAYKLNDNVEVSQNFTENLNAGEIAEVIFTQQIDLSAFSDNYVLKVYTKLNGDENASSDTITNHYIYRENVDLFGFRFRDAAIENQYHSTNSPQVFNDTYHKISFGSNTPQDVSVQDISAPTPFNWQTHGAIMAGCYADGKIYAFTANITAYGEDIAATPKNFVVLDADFNVLSSNVINNLNEANGVKYYPSDLTYDYTTGKLHGLYADQSLTGEIMYRIEFNKTNGNVINKQALQYHTKCFAANNNGKFYGITYDGYFAEIAADGSMQIIANTGVYEVFRLQQSAAFDHRTGRFFWTAAGYDVGNLYEIDMQGNIVDFGKINQGTEVTCLYTPHIGVQDGIDEVQDSGFKIEIYPNPVNDELRIMNYEFKGNETIQIVDIAGRVVLSTILTSTQSPMSLNIAHLPSGVYLVKAGSQTARFIKK